MTAYGVHNWNHSSKRHVTLVALDGLETRGRPQTEASSFGKAGWGFPVSRAQGFQPRPCAEMICTAPKGARTA
jgi:hypothetical protein